jgi:hypothetical protein
VKNITGQEVVSMDVLLSTKDTAKVLGISFQLLERMRAQGRGPAYHTLGGRRLYRRPILRTGYLQIGLIPGIGGIDEPDGIRKGPSPGNKS